MSNRKYYIYDHSQQDWCNRFILNDFGKFMDFIENEYDSERHSVQDSLRSHKECCKDNDIVIEENENE